jgi:polar amino acid transport system substrate-binding protein
MKRRLPKVIFILMAASLFLAACAGQGPGPAPVGETYTIATDATWPPFEYIDTDTEEIVGFDIDLMNAIAERAGFQVEYVNVAWDPLLAGVSGCQYDAAISAMTITDERAETMLFSDPYFNAGQLVVVRTDETAINSVDDLSGKLVGAQLGTTGAIEAENMANVTLRTYDEIGFAFQDLMNGQIDAVIADDALAHGYIAQNSARIKAAGEPFTNEFLGVAVCQRNTELHTLINQGLADVRADGTFDQLVQRWFLEE